MVYWITGRRNSGKTTLACKIAKQTNGVVIDGDEIRKIYPTGFSDDDRYNHIIRMAKSAKKIEDSGQVAIVACISPKSAWRKEAQNMFVDCVEIMLPFGDLWAGTEYEE